MTTLEAQLYEFRCTRCWHQNYADVEIAGTLHACQSCGVEFEAPEATADRIARAESLNIAPESLTAPKLNPQLSDSDVESILRAENDVPIAQRDFAGLPDAGLVARFIARTIDGICNMVAVFLGVFGVLLLEDVIPIVNSQEEITMIALACMLFPFLVLQIVQWNFIATQGKTIGKALCMIRVVSSSGKVPGFIQGVIVREWVTWLFSFVPLLPLVDVLFIFGNSARCLHDFMADTRVVQS